MKFGSTILLLCLSGIAWSSDAPLNNYYPGYGYTSHAYPGNSYPSNSYPSYGYPDNNTYYNYQANTYQTNYYQQGYYPAPAYPVQNQYGYYKSETHQPPVYYAPAYAYPADQNSYAYANYYQAPYQKQEQPYTPAEYSNTDSSTAVSPKTIEKKVPDKKQQTARLSTRTIKKLTQSERKKQFLKQILPLVINENRQIQKDREKMLTILNEWNKTQLISTDKKQWLRQLAKQYRISGSILDNNDLQQDLIKRVNGISPAMALAQAANESAWGTSRFSKLGNNLFGIWTYNEKIGIKPLKREPGKKHFVRKFSSFQESVIVYMHTLNTHAASKKLRDIRHQAVLKGEKLSGYELARGLEKYSAKGQDYIKMIQQMINHYNLENMQPETIALSEMAFN